MPSDITQTLKDLGISLKIINEIEGIKTFIQSNKPTLLHELLLDKGSQFQVFKKLTNNFSKSLEKEMLSLAKAPLLAKEPIITSNPTEEDITSKLTWLGKKIDSLSESANQIKAKKELRSIETSLQKSKKVNIANICKAIATLQSTIRAYQQAEWEAIIKNSEAISSEEIGTKISILVLKERLPEAIALARCFEFTQLIKSKTISIEKGVNPNSRNNTDDPVVTFNDLMDIKTQYWAQVKLFIGRKGVALSNTAKSKNNLSWFEDIEPMIKAQKEKSNQENIKERKEDTQPRTKTPNNSSVSAQVADTEVINKISATDFSELEKKIGLLQGRINDLLKEMEILTNENTSLKENVRKHDLINKYADPIYLDERIKGLEETAHTFDNLDFEAELGGDSQPNDILLGIISEKSKEITHLKKNIEFLSLSMKNLKGESETSSRHLRIANLRDKISTVTGNNIIKLNEEILALNKTVTNLQIERNNLAGALDNLGTEFENAKKEWLVYKGQLLNKATEFDKINQALKETEKRNQKLINEHSQKEEAVRSLTTEKNALIKSMEELKAQHIASSTTFRKTEEALKNANENLSGINEKTQTQLERKTAETRHLSTEISNLKQRLKEQKNQLEENKAHLTKQEKIIHRLNIKLSKIQQIDIPTLQSQLHDKQQEINNAKENHSKALGEQQRHYDKLESAFSQTKTKLHDLTNDYETLQTDKATIIRDLETTKQEKAKLEERITDLISASPRSLNSSSPKNRAQTNNRPIPSSQSSLEYPIIGAYPRRGEEEYKMPIQQQNDGEDTPSLLGSNPSLASFNEASRISRSPSPRIPSDKVDEIELQSIHSDSLQEDLNEAEEQEETSLIASSVNTAQRPAEPVAESAAVDEKSQVKETITRAFLEKARQLMVNRPYVQALGITENTLATTTIANLSQTSLISDLTTRIGKIYQNRTQNNEPLLRKEMKVLFASKEQEIELAIEKTLTGLEAIASLFQKITPDEVKKLLLHKTTAILDTELAAQGYLTSKTALAQLKQQIDDLTHKGLSTAKANLEKQLIESNTPTPLDQIAALDNDKILLLTSLVQAKTDTSESLLQQAHEKAIHCARTEIESYRNKAPKDLEKYYGATLAFIENIDTRIQLAMRNATSRELLAFAKEEQGYLKHLVDFIRNGKLTEKRQELEEKMAHANLSAIEKNAYQNSIKSIREITESKKGTIEARLLMLEMMKKPLQAIIDKNNQDSKQAIMPSASPSHFFKLTKSVEELNNARTELLNKLSPDLNSHSFAAIKDAHTHKIIEFEPGNSLLEAAKITTKKGKESTFTYQAIKTDHMIEFSIDSINGDTRPTFIKKHSNNPDFIRISTQSILEFAQGTGESPAEKGMGLLILNTNDPNWKQRLAYIKAHQAVFKNQRLPLLLLEGKYTNTILNEPKFNRQLQQLVNKYIQEYHSEKSIDNQFVNAVNTQTRLIAPGA